MSQPESDPYRPPTAPLGPPPEARGPTEPVEGNPWLTIWTRPRGTIRRIVDADPAHGVIALGAISGFTGVLFLAYKIRLGDRLEPGSILAFATVIGTTSGILRVYLVGAFLSWTGSWLGGVATPREARAAFAWGSVPNAAALALFALMILAGGPGLFQTAGLARLGPPLGSLIEGLDATASLLGIWGLVLVLRAVAEVHQFSSWMALAAGFLTALLLASLFLVTVALMLATGTLQPPAA